MFLTLKLDEDEITAITLMLNRAAEWAKANGAPGKTDPDDWNQVVAWMEQRVEKFSMAVEAAKSMAVIEMALSRVDDEEP